MKDFLSNLSSPYWWISVVIVGIVINLFSSYLQKRLDDQLSKASSWWRKRSEKEEAKKIKRIEALKNNPQAQVHMEINNFTFIVQASVCIQLAFSIFLTMATIKLITDGNEKNINIVLVFLAICSAILMIVTVSCMRLYYYFHEINFNAILARIKEEYEAKLENHEGNDVKIE